ncbi:MAG TPA: transcription elongation factor GreA [bacterium]|nr:transcription elongation factor GreA [Myxococcales bacterium]OQA62204.1 MAG: Transcription elongation factor GreA [bacterium ADurb.Bin270]HPW45776.1 transcription elongation factor GreA [bacterium]HQC50359.1 transcription elongation factor GreA [bacterium]HQG13144.1 transcription elongation factor GreA [bacterium]
MHRRIPMTPEGQKILQDKLKYLKQVERPRNVKEIEEAREKGDLSENAEYEAAKEKQQQISLQIQETEHKLSLAQVIDPKSIDSDKISFGATVTLEDIDNDEHVTYFIVGSDESDIGRGKISIESPIARAMIGKSEGDEVLVKTPNGPRNFEIVSIEYR